MNRMTKVALGAMALAVGAGIGSAAIINQAKPLSLAAATTATKTYACTDTPDKFGGFSFSDSSDKSSYYLLPNTSNECLVFKSNVLGTSGLSVDKTQTVTITINHATYGSGTNPSETTFSFFNNTTGKGTAIAGTANNNSTYASSSTFVDAIYTFSANAFSGDDFCIKVTKPDKGKQIRFKSFTISYTKAEVKTVSSIQWSGELTKTFYFDGDEFDPTGLTVTATYVDTSTANVTASVTWSNPVLGQNYVTGTYISGATVTCQSPTISVTALALTSIEVTTLPTKATYIVGEVLDLTGTVVTGTYNSGSTKDVTSDCAFSISDGTTLNTVGTQTIMVTDGAFTATFDIAVNPKVTLDHTSLNFSQETPQTITATGIFSGTPTYEVTASVGGIVQVQVNDNVITVTPIAGGTTILTIRGTHLSESAEATCEVKSALLSSKATLTDTTLGVTGSSYSDNAPGKVDSKSNYTFAWTNLLSSKGIQFKSGSGSLYNLTAWKASISRIILTQSKGTAGVFALYAAETSNATTNLITPAVNGSEYTYDLSTSTYHYFTIKSTTAYFVLSSIVVETVPDEISDYVGEFNTELDKTCSNSAPSAITSATWTTLSASYTSLSSGAKAQIKAVNTETETDVATKKAISRYDYVMAKTAYSAFADFIGRFPSRGASGVNELTKSSSPENVLYIALGIGLVAAGSFYIFSRKKKEA